MLDNSTLTNNKYEIGRTWNWSRASLAHIGPEDPSNRKKTQNSVLANMSEIARQFQHKRSSTMCGTLTQSILDHNRLTGLAGGGQGRSKSAPEMA